MKEKPLQIVITNLTKRQRAWLDSEAERLGLPITSIVKNWINAEIQRSGYERA